MRRLLATWLFALLAFVAAVPAQAQGVSGVVIVASCGTPPSALTPWTSAFPTLGIITVDTTGKACVNASVSVGGFQGNGNFANLTATASPSASTALPTGTTTRITNASSTATVSCTEGTGSATGTVSNIVLPPLSSVSRVNGAFDHISCIDQTGSTGSNLVVLEGGSGLGNDSGGGGGGSGGGTSNITQWATTTLGVPTAWGTAPTGNVPGVNANILGVASGAVAAGAGSDGWDVTQGTKSDSAATNTTGSWSMQSLVRYLINAVQGPIAAGTAIIGKVGIDQTTPGTTNGVQDAATAATGATAPTKAIEGGGISQSAEPTKTTTGFLTGFFTDLVGKLITSPYANRENMARGYVALSGTSAGTILAASGSASLKEYITDITCTRNDTGTTAVSVTLNDTATTVIDLPNNGGGGGYSHTFNVPLAFAANTAATATSGTSITTIHCSSTGFYGY